MNQGWLNLERGKSLVKYKNLDINSFFWYIKISSIHINVFERGEKRHCSIRALMNPDQRTRLTLNSSLSKSIERSRNSKRPFGRRRRDRSPTIPRETGVLYWLGMWKKTCCPAFIAPMPDETPGKACPLHKKRYRGKSRRVPLHIPACILQGREVRGCIDRSFRPSVSWSRRGQAEPPLPAAKPGGNTPCRHDHLAACESSSGTRLQGALFIPTQ